MDRPTARKASERAPTRSSTNQVIKIASGGPTMANRSQLRGMPIPGLNTQTAAHAEAVRTARKLNETVLSPVRVDGAERAAKQIGRPGTRMSNRLSKSAKCLGEKSQSLSTVNWSGQIGNRANMKKYEVL